MSTIDFRVAQCWFIIRILWVQVRCANLIVPSGDCHCSMNWLLDTDDLKLLESLGINIPTRGSKIIHLFSKLVLWLLGSWGCWSPSQRLSGKGGVDHGQDTSPSQGIQRPRYRSECSHWGPLSELNLFQVSSFKRQSRCFQFNRFHAHVNYKLIQENLKDLFFYLWRGNCL